eukprot:2911661-Alexandrium_andersonii.AAC.1
MGPRRRRAPGDLPLVHPGVVHVDVQATPIRAWRAADEQERPARGDEPDRPLAVSRVVEVPRLASRTRAQVQGS